MHKNSVTWTADERLEIKNRTRQLFRSYAVEQAIDVQSFSQMAQECELLHPRKLPAGEVVLVFSRVKLAKKKTIGMREFEEALRQMAVRRNMSFAAIVDFAGSKKLALPSISLEVLRYTVTTAFVAEGAHGTLAFMTLSFVSPIHDYCVCYRAERQSRGCRGQKGECAEGRVDPSRE
jgi:hypothetical protein